MGTNEEGGGRLSPGLPPEEPETAEGRFDRVRGAVGLFLGPAPAAALWLLPLPLEPRPHRRAAILAGVVVFRVTEAIPIPVTALLGMAG